MLAASLGAAGYLAYATAGSHDALLAQLDLIRALLP